MVTRRVSRRRPTFMHACMHACMDGWTDGWMDIHIMYIHVIRMFYTIAHGHFSLREEHYRRWSVLSCLGDKV